MSAVLKPKNSKPVRERVSREEWQMRVDLAAAYQLAAIYKWTDLIYTHFSARVPGSDDFLINAYGLMFDEITASNLVRIDARGKVIDDPLTFHHDNERSSFQPERRRVPRRRCCASRRVHLAHPSRSARR
jgi:hypothetical protein